MLYTIEKTFKIEFLYTSNNNLMKGLFLFWLGFLPLQVFKEHKILQIDMIPEKICTDAVSQRDGIFHDETACEHYKLVSCIYMQAFIIFLHCCHPISIKDSGLAR